MWTWGLSDRARARVAHYFNFLVLASWAVIPLLVMGWLNSTGHSADWFGERYISLDLWLAITIVWAVAFALLFFLMLRRFFAEMQNAAARATAATTAAATAAASPAATFAPSAAADKATAKDTEVPSARANEVVVQSAKAKEAEVQARIYLLEVLLGMICSLSLGFPAIFLGAMPLVSTTADSFWQHYSGNYGVEIPADRLLLDDGRRNFLIGIDVSHSFLGNPDRPGSDRERVAQIGAILTFLLDKEGPIGWSFDEDDQINVLVFAGSHDYVQFGLQRSDVGNVAFLAGVVEELRRNKLYEWRKIGGLNNERTHLLSFLDSAVRQAQCGSGKKFDSATLVIFSDLKESTSAGGETSVAEVEHRIRATSGCEVSLVTFVAPALTRRDGQNPAADANDDDDATDELESLLDRRQWRGPIVLGDYHEAVVAGNNGKLFGEPLGLYRSGERCESALCLRLPYPRGAPTQKSWVRLRGPQFKTVAVGLQPARSPGDKEPNFGVLLHDGRGPHVALRSDGKRFDWWSRPDGASKMSIMADNDEYAEGVGERYLSLAIPEAGVFYQVDLELAKNKNEKLIEALNLVFLILNGLPLVLAVFIWLERRRRYRAKWPRTVAAAADDVGD